MKDASGKRQQSSFKSFHNKPRNKNILLMGVKNKKCSEVFIEFNTSQFSFSKQEQDEIIEYVKTNLDKLLKKIRNHIVGKYLVKRTLDNGKNFLVKFYE